MKKKWNHKYQIKRVNEIKDRGRKIRVLMDILEKKNQEIIYLRKKLWSLEHPDSQQTIEIQIVNYSKERQVGKKAKK